MSREAREKLEKAYLKFENKMKSGGMSISVEDKKGEFSWRRQSGNLLGDKQYCIASVTKMFTTAVVLRLVDEKKLNLDDAIKSYLTEETMQGLHVYKGKEYSQTLTVEHLMTQTSGLPDYFTEAPAGQISIEKRLDTDVTLSFEETLAITKQLDSHFPPGNQNKAFYSDINWDILPGIVEAATGINLKTHFESSIFEPLELKHTFLFTSESNWSFPGVFFRGSVQKLPKMLAGWPASGGIISTNSDMLIFLKAFWNGNLFNPTHFEKIRAYRSTQFFPMKYGMGTMRWKYPGIPELIGHSGSTGVISYYAPGIEMYITGCINEMNEVKATQFLMNIAKAVK